MFLTNLKIALRNLRKNKLYAIINIGGLTIGLAIYLFGYLLIEYESTHDTFFTNSDRIYTIGSVFVPNLNFGIPQTTTTYTAVKPIIDTDLADVEASARTINREYVTTYEDQSYYEEVVFADLELLRIFDFTYIQGGAEALANPSGMVLTETAAIKYFGETDVLGKIITLNNQHEFEVTAVISIPINSHFSASLTSGGVELIGSLERLQAISNFEHEGGWNNLSLEDNTYVLLPPTLDGQWLQAQLDGIFDRITNQQALDTISEFRVAPVYRANLSWWDTVGAPLPEIITTLCLLVLITACLNYTNLAVAQFMGRTQEVGMRKAVGASQAQLLWQFIMESMVITVIAMLCAVALVELIIPLFNNLTNKILQLEYRSTLPWLISTPIAVGLLVGIYPAWIITGTSAAEALRDATRKGKQGAITRSLMIGVQFAISVFMLAFVAVMFVQNKSLDQESYIFPRSEIYTLHRLEAVGDRLETLQRELESISGVESVAYSSQVPFEQTNNLILLTSAPGDEANAIRLNRLRITPEFFTTYDIPILAGRNLDRNRADDEFHLELGQSQTINILVNELALQSLDIGSPEEAINKRVYTTNADNIIGEAIIVGVVPTQNIQGFTSPYKPWAFYWDMNSRWMDTASIRISSNQFQQVVGDIEKKWNQVIPDYPIRGWFLDHTFNQGFTMLTTTIKVIGGFAIVAMLLAMMGLFGLAVFYSSQRTKEIGVRKALGASSKQITRLLVWQFSKPVLWALLVAVPAAFFASNQYLNIFGDRIDSTLWILILAGVASVLLSWITVGGQAYSVARANPITALRYE